MKVGIVEVALLGLPSSRFSTNPAKAGFNTAKPVENSLPGLLK